MDSPPKSKEPYLPPELLGRIFEFVPDTYRLWTWRQLSPMFKSEIDRVIAKQCRIQDFTIVLKNELDRVEYYRRLGFQRLSEDGARAYFRTRKSRPAEVSIGPFWKMIKRWRNLWFRQLVPYLDDPDEIENGKLPTPKHYLWDCGSVMAFDTELPDLEVDSEKLEISFDWGKMMDLCYGEEERSMSLMTMTGERPPIGEETDRFRVEARKERIVEWYKAHHDYDIDLDTDDIAESLRKSVVELRYKTG